MKKLIAVIVLLFIGLTATFSQKAEIFTINGKAIRGYDVVAIAFGDAFPSEFGASVLPVVGDTLRS